MNKIDGRILKNLREQKGYSLRQLAQKLFVSKTTVQRWENEGLPDDEEVLLKVANVFKISVDDLKNMPQSPQKKDGKKYRERRMKVEQYVEAKYGLKWLFAVLAISVLVIIIINII